MLVKTDKDVARMLRAMEGVVSTDIEGTALNPFQKRRVVKVKKVKTLIDDPAKVSLIGFGTKSDTFQIPAEIVGSPWSMDEVSGIMVEVQRKLERDCISVMHNGKFDVLWIWAHTGIRLPLDFDTMLADYMVNENVRHGLDDLAARWLGEKAYDLPLREKQGHLGLTPNLLKYHAKDLIYTRQCYFKLKAELAKDEATQRIFTKLMMPLARLYTEAQYDGIVVDETKFDDAEKYLRGEYNDALASLKRWEIPVFSGKGKKRKQTEFNWGSTTHLRALLFDHLKITPPVKTKKGAPSTSESALNQIDHKCVGDLIKFRGAKQQLSFFIDGWKPHLRWRRVKGQRLAYLHPSMKLHGTVTGRPSCENPNLFQVPRDPRIRTLITSEPGWTFVECDLSQIEMRLAAEVSRDTMLLTAFRDGIDVHWMTAIREIERGHGLPELVIATAHEYLKRQAQAKRRNSEPDEPTYAEAIDILLEMGPDTAIEIDGRWKEYRKKAKAVNFGYLYGMWWKKFKTYARDNYGVEITDKQAEESRTYYFQTYQSLEPWHTRQKRYARLNGYVRSLSGRMRRLPDAQLVGDDRDIKGKRSSAERQAINSPIQSFANEINFMSAIQLRQEYGRDKVKIVGTVYDAILMRVRDDYVEEVTERLLQIMSCPPMFKEFDIKLTVPILGEAKIGPWGGGIDFHKWKEMQ